MVYCLTKADCMIAAAALVAAGVAAEEYTSDLKLAERVRRQDAWRAGRTRVMCATDAFGLGIVRLI